MRLIIILLFTLADLSTYAQRASMIAVDDGVELYCVEQGSGQPVIFIPGWTMTTKFFSNQLKALSDDFRVLTFDPRSHGKSTKTTAGNTYLQHARDLQLLMEHLKLSDVVLVGWSSGAHTIFSYLREFGTKDLAKVVILDETPKWIGDASKEWVYGSYDDYYSSVRGILETREKDAEGIAKWMSGRELTKSEIAWMKEEMMLTPTHAAFMLYVDSIFSDYTQEVTSLASKIPMLFMLRSSWFAQAQAWLEKNAPAASVVKVSSHLAFWEEPEEFNSALMHFLDSKPSEVDR